MARSPDPQEQTVLMALAAQYGTADEALAGAAGLRASLSLPKGVAAKLSVCVRLIQRFQNPLAGKETYNLDGQMIEKVRRLFDVRTETEAIHKALAKVVEDREIEESLNNLLKEARFRTIYR